jgi:predicted nucleotidyltransferase
MAIPGQQLNTWSKIGSITGSSQTYNLIRETLEDPVAPYHGKNYSVFLQGSYANDTNIIGESDVDIVIVLKDCWQSDLSGLDEPQKAAYKQAFVDATYGHADFKRDVLNVLRNEYGNEVEPGNKALYVLRHR